MFQWLLSSYVFAPAKTRPDAASPKAQPAPIFPWVANPKPSAPLLQANKVPQQALDALDRTQTLDIRSQHHFSRMFSPPSVGSQTTLTPERYAQQQAPQPAAEGVLRAGIGDQLAFLQQVRQQQPAPNTPRRGAAAKQQNKAEGIVNQALANLQDVVADQSRSRGHRAAVEDILQAALLAADAPRTEQRLGAKALMANIHPERRCAAERNEERAERAKDAQQPVVNDPWDPVDCLKFVEDKAVAKRLRFAPGTRVRVMTSAYGTFAVSNTLVRGASGKCRLGLRLSNGESVAFKELRSEFAAKPPAGGAAKKTGISQMTDIVAEVKITLALSPHIKIYGATWWHGKYYLIMNEFRGALDEIAPCTEAEQRDRVAYLAARNGARDLAYVHERGYLHCDVKNENMLVSLAGQPVLADFGLACPLDEEDTYRSGSVFGTYFAPETVQRQADRSYHYTPAADVWCLGVSLCNFYLDASENPFRRSHHPVYRQVGQQRKVAYKWGLAGDVNGYARYAAWHKSICDENGEVLVEKILPGSRFGDYFSQLFAYNRGLTTVLLNLMLNPDPDMRESAAVIAAEFAAELTEEDEELAAMAYRQVPQSESFQVAQHNLRLFRKDFTKPAQPVATR